MNMYRLYACMWYECVRAWEVRCLMGVMDMSEAAGAGY